MRITSLIDDLGSWTLSGEHGLSLLLALSNGQVGLFDMGQTGLFARHAKQLGKDIQTINWAVISHGHYDHGGGLNTFLEQNATAPVYIQERAFEPHFSQHADGLHRIGIDAKLKTHSQIQLCDGDCSFSLPRSPYTMRLLTVTYTTNRPADNRRLFGQDGKTPDDFRHEQSLLVTEDDKTYLFAGCAHGGILNIIRKATEVIGHAPTYVIGGMHLSNSTTDNADIQQLAHQLRATPCQFITMHCTGKYAYEQLKQIMGNHIRYLSCGETIEL